MGFINRGKALIAVPTWLNPAALAIDEIVDARICKFRKPKALLDVFAAFSMAITPLAVRTSFWLASAFKTSIRTSTSPTYRPPFDFALWRSRANSFSLEIAFLVSCMA